VGNVSLVGRAVKCAFESKVLDHVLVSTDDEAIRQEALLYGAEVPFLRPKHLADDYASTEDTVVHAIEAYEEIINNHLSIIAFIEPTNPFRSQKSFEMLFVCFKMADTSL